MPDTGRVSAVPKLSCVACPHNNDGLCGAILTDAEVLSASGAVNWRDYRLARAGAPIIRAHQTSDEVFVLCQGWAFRYLNLPSGRRQILNFMLPGDVLSLSSIFESRVHFAVKALTDVQISAMRRVEVHSRLLANPSVGSLLAKLSSAQE